MTKSSIHILKEKGIKTTEDLDKYRESHPSGDSIHSRYSTLKHLIGEQEADKAIHELMVNTKGFLNG